MDLDVNKTSRHIFECEINDNFNYNVDEDKFNDFLEEIQSHPNAYNLTKSEMAKYGIEIENASIDRIKINAQSELQTKEFICVKIRGESFLYHMIRKMIGLVMQCMLNDKDESFVTTALNSFTDENIMHIPLAPAEGLLLVSPMFTYYDVKKDIPAKLEMDIDESTRQNMFFEQQLKNRICHEVNSTQCFEKFRKAWENEPKL